MRYISSSINEYHLRPEIGLIADLEEEKSFPSKVFDCFNLYPKFSKDVFNNISEPPFYYTKQNKLFTAVGGR